MRRDKGRMHWNVCIGWGGDDEMLVRTGSSILFVRIDGILYTGNTVEAPLQYNHPYNHPYKHPYNHHNPPNPRPSFPKAHTAHQAHTTTHDPPPPSWLFRPALTEGVCGAEWVPIASSTPCAFPEWD